MAHQLLRERTLPMIPFSVARPRRDQAEACVAEAEAEADAEAGAGAGVEAALMKSTTSTLQVFRALYISDLQPYHNNQALCYS